MCKFAVGMNLGTLEVVKVTDKTITVKVGDVQTRIKKHISEYGHGEYIVLDLATLSFLNLVDSNLDVLDNELCSKFVWFRNKFKRNEMAYRLFAYKLTKEQEKKAMNLDLGELVYQLSQGIDAMCRELNLTSRQRGQLISAVHGNLDKYLYNEDTTGRQMYDRTKN